MKTSLMENWLNRCHIIGMRLQDYLQLIKIRCCNNFSRYHISIPLNSYQSCNWFGVIFIVAATIFFLNAYNYAITSQNDNEVEILLETNTFQLNLQSNASKKEDKMACNLPKLDPFDSSIIEFIEVPPNVECTSSFTHPKLFRTNFKNKLIQMADFNGSCCYKTLKRKPGDDRVMTYSSDCFPIRRKVTIIPSSHEFIQVFCQIFISKEDNSSGTKLVETNYTDMFAFVPSKYSENPIKKKDALNVIILGLDGQSHMNFIRQMPQTYHFIMDNLSAIEFNGYTKVGDNTFPNIIPLLTGKNISEFKKNCWRSKNSYFDACPFIWKEFKSKSNYLTSLAEDAVWMSIFLYDKLGFSQQPTDYYLNPFALQMSTKLGHNALGNARLCYGPRFAFEVLLEYMVKTSVRFYNQTDRIFQFIWANSLFHDYLNYPSLGDELLYLTLKWLSNGGYLNNTMLILLSDHGIRWSSIRSTFQGRLEERLPMLYFIFPEWFTKKYSVGISNMKINTNRLTSPFDIYETLSDLLDVDKLENDKLVKVARKNKNLSRGHGHNRRGLSLFQEIPKSRTCEAAEIDDHWCTCYLMKSISNTSPIVTSAAKFIVMKINQMLTSNSELGIENNLCAKLRLVKIVNALRKVDEDTINNSNYNIIGKDFNNNNNLSTNEQAYSSSLAYDSTFKQSNNNGKNLELQLTLIVEPGEGIYEATIYKTNSNNNDEWKISSEISRLNLYGEQSQICINDSILQKYCYCITNTNNNSQNIEDNPLSNNNEEEDIIDEKGYGFNEFLSITRMTVNFK